MAPKTATWSNIATHGVENATARARAREDAPLDPPPTHAQHDSVDYVAEQNDEIEAIQSIYPDEFEYVEVKDAWKSSKDKAFRLRLTSSENDELQITLSVRFTASYPKTVPPIELEKSDNLKPKTVQAVRTFIHKRAQELVGNVMIFDLADGIREILDEAARNKVRDDAGPSLAQEHAQSEAKAAQVAEREKEQVKRLAQEAEADHDRMLSEMINREQARREDQERRKNKHKNASNGVSSASETDPSQLTFDRIMTLKDERSTIEFNSVKAISKIRNGRITEILTARPCASDDSNVSCVIIKRMHLKSTVSKKAVQDLEDVLENLRSLEPQSTIISILDFKIEKYSAFAGSVSLSNNDWQITVLTEYADRGSLEEMLEIVDNLPADRVRSWMYDLLSALDYLHRHNIVHQRIHPGNVLICRPTLGGSPSVKLSDAAFQEQLYNLNGLDRKTARHGSAYSAFWIPSELSQNKKHSTKTDVWDLGIVFLQMSLGLHVPSQYSSPSQLVETVGLSDSLRIIIQSIFKPDQQKRPSAFVLRNFEFFRNHAPVFDVVSSSAGHMTMSNSMLGTPTPARLRRESTVQTQRYAEEWTEIGLLGKGGYGEVVKARHKLDHKIYAIKKITMNSLAMLTNVQSEAVYLSHIDHPYVVRYYAVWKEEYMDTSTDEDTSTVEDSTSDPTGTDADFLMNTTGGLDFMSSSGMPPIVFANDSDDEDEEVNGQHVVFSDSETEEETDTEGSNSKSKEKLVLKRTTSSNRSTRPLKITLYIQMEYCERRTLRDLIKNDLFDKVDDVWRLFRQILEGLAHIHGLGIIHRDLKPDNIFINAAGNPRIGDLGLATTGRIHTAARSLAPGALDGNNMTRSVGTTYYVAPEVRSSNEAGYSFKADMYSLGIIFFEMCHPLKTAMERDNILRRVREKDHWLPEELNSPDKAAQRSIILSLITHRPSDRPTSQDLLRSDKLPLKIEEPAIQHVLTALGDPDSPYYGKMMTTILSNSANDAVKDLKWDIPSTSGSQALKNPEVIQAIRNFIIERMTAVFRRHGAIESQRSLIFPRSPFYDDRQDVVQFLDPSGTVLQLAHDLTLPHARSLARPSRDEPAPSKSYTFGSVYRTTHEGSAPKMIRSAEFAIVSDNSLDLALKEAEVIKVVDEVIEEIPTLAATKVCFHINHSILLDLILEYCRIDSSQRSGVKLELSSLNIRGLTWQKVAAQLRTKIGVSSTSLDDLKRFDWRDSPEKALGKMEKILDGSDVLDRARAVFDHLRALLGYIKTMGVQHKNVYISPLSNANEKLYSGGILIQCLYDTKSLVVLGAGGRYDRLIQDLRPPRSYGNFSGAHAVGFSFAWDSIAASMSENVYNLKWLKKQAKPGGFNRELRSCDILVASFDSVVLRSECVSLMSWLWSHDLRAELAGDARSTDELLHSVRDQKYSWIIIIRQDSHSIGKPEIRVRVTRDNADFDVNKSELLSFLRNDFRERDQLELGNNNPTRAHLRSATLSGSANGLGDDQDASRVSIITPNHRSKKTNRTNIVESSSQRVRELIGGWTACPILAMDCRPEYLESLRETRLSDGESWRRVIHGVPLAERKYFEEVFKKLRDFAEKWRKDGCSNEGRMAFVTNFKGGSIVPLDLGA